MPLNDEESVQVSVQERQADEDWLTRWYAEVLPEIEFIEDQDRREIDYHLHNI